MSKANSPAGKKNERAEAGETVTAKAPAGSSTGPVPENQPQHGSYRETVESIIVAFILAFLFRAFVAEAFVIPTGSMAPTLMGAHKDTVCEHCGALYQSTASYEYDPNTQLLDDNVAIGSTCAECRGVNAFDLAENGNHTTFSGDRILVSKFDYLFSSPSRWDVLVFKYPGDARLNYIKRLVGLPGEQLRIEEGDVYVRREQKEPWSLVRKPPHKIQAMLQVVSDTDHQPRDIVSKGWPSLWQPVPAPTQVAAQADTNNTWQAGFKETVWSATLPKTAVANQTQWLRYYHKYLDEGLWEATLDGTPLPKVDVYASTLITDFLAYNTTKFGRRRTLYPDGQLRSDITTDNRAVDVLSPINTDYIGLNGTPQEGEHWVGDLAVECNVEVKGNEGKVSLDLVEFGVHYRCDFDVASGTATLHSTDGATPENRELDLFVDPNGKPIIPKASSSVRGGGTYRLMMSNVDDQLHVWVNGKLLKFDHSTSFDSHVARSGAARRPYWTASDPLDAAPVGIGGAGVELVIHRAQVWRDIYYIAIRENGRFSDFSKDDETNITDSIPDPVAREMLRRDRRTPGVTWWYAQPEAWDKTDLFARRGSLEFTLGPDDFFPMGDNSAASSDARAWIGHNYVERRFLIGKALLVFWPHPWMSPIPYPNISRIRLIH